MPDERNIAHDKKVMDEEKIEDLEITGEHPEHAPQPGRKTPQEHEDENAINESGELLHPKKTDDSDEA